MVDTLRDLNDSLAIMEPVTHDWIAILKEEGDDLLAPSCMQYLDTSLDVQGTFRKFWKVMEEAYRAEGYGDPRSKALQAGGYCDTVTLNLIATHTSVLLHPKRITDLFVPDASVAGNRRSVLMMIALSEDESYEGLDVLRATTILNDSTSNLLRKKYLLSTDEGFTGQVALTRLTIGVLKNASRFLKYRVLGATSGMKETAWYSNEELVEYTLANPEKVQRILAAILERKTDDVDLIRECAESPAVALSAGTL